MGFNSGFKGLNKINIHNTSCVLTCESLLLICKLYATLQNKLINNFLLRNEPYPPPPPQKKNKIRALTPPRFQFQLRLASLLKTTQSVRRLAASRTLMGFESL